MAEWLINTVRIAIEQRRIMQKVDSNRFEENPLQKRLEAPNSGLGWSNERVCHVKERERAAAFLWRALLC